MRRRDARFKAVRFVPILLAVLAGGMPLAAQEKRSVPRGPLWKFVELNAAAGDQEAEHVINEGGVAIDPQARNFLVPAEKADELESNPFVARVSAPVDLVTDAKEVQLKDCVKVGAYVFDPANVETDVKTKMNPMLPPGLDADPPVHLAGHIILQFQDPPTSRERDALGKLGLRLEHHLQGGAYLASLDPETGDRVQGSMYEELEAQKTRGMLRSWRSLRPAMKIDPGIVIGATSFRAVARYPQIEVVSEHSRIDAELLVDVASYGRSLATLCAQLKEFGQVLRACEGDTGDEQPIPNLIEGPEAEHFIAPSEFQVKIFVATYADLQKLANLPAVRWIARSGQATLRNATTSWVIQTGQRGVRRLFTRGLRGQGEVIGFLDTPFDFSHCFFFPDADQPPPAGKKIVSYRRGAGIPAESERHAHGTEVAGILAGRDVFSPGNARSGQAPEAKLAFRDLVDAVTRGVVRKPLLDAFDELYHEDGARIFSNSWGDDTESQYTELARAADQLMEWHPDALVVVAASNSGQVRTPENARNALAVGASRQADLFTQVAGREFSSIRKGPSPQILGATADGRLKPEIFAPGCRIETAAVRTACEVRRVSGEQRISDPFGFGGTISANCGTSYAAAAVGGAAALVRQYFREGRHPTGEPTPLPPLGNICTPTGALIKAMLLNGTRDMTKAPSPPSPNEYPSAAEGWGLLRLDDSLFLGESDEYLKTAVVDEEVANGASGLGQGNDPKYRFYVDLPPPGPREDTRIKVTLVWKDLQVAGSSDPIVNNLDLIVQEEDGDRRTFCGNHFHSSSTPAEVGFSLAATGSSCDGISDLRNNVEQVVLPAPTSRRSYLVTVKATSVSSASRQGFALVVSGGLDPGNRIVSAFGCSSLEAIPRVQAPTGGTR